MLEPNGVLDRRVAADRNGDRPAGEEGVAPPASSHALHVRDLSKTFPGQVALDRVDLCVAAGSTHALVGQNGSGKSTFIKILAGYHEPDHGWSATIAGEPFQLGSARDASAKGIRFVHQDLGLVDSISTVENLRLGFGYETSVGFRINWRTETARARETMRTLGFADFDVRAPVGTLQSAQKAAVAIARALQDWEDNVSLLVLDEPTATLPGADVERLFGAVRRLQERGVAILYVSHHLDEVFALADEVTVLRDGHKVTTRPPDELDHSGLIALIVGRQVATRTAGNVSARQGAPQLDHPLVVQGLRGATTVDATFSVGAGEIVGLAGITGSGRESVIGLLTGQLPREAGSVEAGGAVIANYSPSGVLGSGVAFVPADRAAFGVVPLMSVRSNITLGGLHRHVRRLRLRHRAESVEASDWIQRLSIKTAGDEAPLGTLSGGNQQKVLFARALRAAPKVLVLDCPTSGIDVGAKEQIHVLIQAAAGGGAAVLIASTDTDELVRLCSRVLVMRRGRIVESITGSDITVEYIEHSQLQGDDA